MVRPEHFMDGLSSTAAMSEKVVGSFGTTFRPPTDTMLLPYALSSPPDWPTAEQWVQYCRTVRPGAVFRTDNGATWVIADNLYTTYNHTVGPNSEVVDCGRFDTHPRNGLFPARSRHPGLVNVLMMDGSTKSVTDAIALHTWRALSTRSAADGLDDL
jgi:prepilin-type processing-associated H-X9-DG protein